MGYKKYFPPQVLKQYVRYFWSFDCLCTQSTKLRIKSFADVYPRLVFPNVNSFSPITSLSGENLPVCYLSGIDTKHTEVVMSGSFSHFGVSFYPHALNAFFRIEANELLNQTPDIGILGNSDIGDRLERAKSHLTRVQILSKYLFDKIYHANGHDPLINHIIHSNDIHETANVSFLVREYKVSERQLERKFNANVGISPKRLRRIARFKKSIRLLVSAEYAQLTTIAHALNYTDQSHFISEFKAFSGMTPYEFVRNPSFGSESSSFIYIPNSTLGN
jgi:AraC-like DNA-binding protein